MPPHSNRSRWLADERRLHLAKDRLLASREYLRIMRMLSGEVGDVQVAVRQPARNAVPTPSQEEAAKPEPATLALPHPPMQPLSFIAPPPSRRPPPRGETTGGGRLAAARLAALSATPASPVVPATAAYSPAAWLRDVPPAATPKCPHCKQPAAIVSAPPPKHRRCTISVAAALGLAPLSWEMPPGSESTAAGIVDGTSASGESVPESPPKPWPEPDWMTYVEIRRVACLAAATRPV